MLYLTSWTNLNYLQQEGDGHLVLEASGAEILHGVRPFVVVHFTEHVVQLQGPELVTQVRDSRVVGR